MVEDNEIWRKAINDMALPSEGTGPPEIEAIKEESLDPDGESPVLLQKIVTEVYVFTSLDHKKAFFGTQPFQDIQVLGEMRLAEAVSIIDSAKKKRRRKRN